jgi:choline dehydrogenase
MLSFARLLLGAIFPFAGAAATNVYDYVIVGGGATGLSLAVRLSEDPNRTVVVLEAGNRYRSPLLTRILIYHCVAALESESDFSCEEKLDH